MIKRISLTINLLVRIGNNDIVEMLTKNGANVNAKDDDGKTPLDIATAEGKKQQEH